MRGKAERRVAAEHGNELGPKRARLRNERRHQAEERMAGADLQHRSQRLLHLPVRVGSERALHRVNQVLHRQQDADVGFGEKKHCGSLQPAAFSSSAHQLMIHTIQTIDAHTAGEPLRLIVGGFPTLQGSTMLDKREWLRENYDHLRTALMLEPRGHTDMYGALLTEPERAGSDAGVLFMHNEGYSTMCGHGVIAVVTIALERGLLHLARAARTSSSIPRPVRFARARRSPRRMDGGVSRA